MIELLITNKGNLSVMVSTYSESSNVPTEQILVMPGNFRQVWVTETSALGIEQANTTNPGVQNTPDTPNPIR